MTAQKRVATINDVPGLTTRLAGLDAQIAALNTAAALFLPGNGVTLETDFSALTPGNLAPTSATGANGVRLDAGGGAVLIPPFDHVFTEAASRIQFVTLPRRSGKGALRFELHQSDVNHDGVSERVSLNANDVGKLFFAGNEIYVAFSYMHDKNTPINPPTSADFFQVFQLFAGDVHSIPQVLGGSPVFSIELSPTGGKWRAVCRGGDKASSGASSPFIGTTAPTDLGLATVGVWHDFLCHGKLSANMGDTTGYWDIKHRIAGQAWPTTWTRILAKDSATQTTLGPNITSILGGSPLPMYYQVQMYRTTRSETAVGYYGGQLVRNSQNEAEEFFADQFQYETPIVKQINGSGLTDGQIDALLGQVIIDGEQVYDTNLNKFRSRVAGAWLPAS